MRRAGAVILLAAAAAGCSALGLGPTPEITAHPADFAVVYEWREGSLPPPYYYEYAIRLGPGPQGEVVFTPDYAFNNPPVWTETLAVSDADLTALYKLMVAQGVFTRRRRQDDLPPVGGSSAWARITADGREVSIPSLLETRDAQAIAPVYEAIRALAPEAVWNKLRAQHEEYKQAHPDG